MGTLAKERISELESRIMETFKIKKKQRERLKNKTPQNKIFKNCGTTSKQ